DRGFHTVGHRNRDRGAAIPTDHHGSAAPRIAGVLAPCDGDRFLSKPLKNPSDHLFSGDQVMTRIRRASSTALPMQIVVTVIALALFTAGSAAAQGTSRTLVAVFAHGDDEGAAAPILAGYAREGVQVYLIIATDGAQGGAHTSIPRGPELARVRSEEAHCAANALGIHAPILLGFPDAQLGNYME